MKKIGFVDYYLSEWHANNYPQWLAEACEQKGLDYKVCYAWAEEEVSPVDGVTTAQWCEKYGVEACATIDELCEKSDVIIVLAPSNPETHLGYAEAVLKHKKLTYIDKTFAPDLATAEQIYAMGEEYGTPFFSTSALRFATELDSYESCRQMMVLGSGSNLAEYIIHEIEIVVKKLGVGANSLKVEHNGAQTYVYIHYPDDRAATLVFARSMPYTVYMASSDPVGPRPVTVTVTSPFFRGLMDEILRFFEEGSVSFSGKETLEVMRLREGALIADNHEGDWINLSML